MEAREKGRARRRPLAVTLVGVICFLHRIETVSGCLKAAGVVMTIVIVAVVANQAELTWVY